MSPCSTRSGKTSMKPSSIGGPGRAEQPAQRERDDERDDPEGEGLASPARGASVAPGALRGRSSSTGRKASGRLAAPEDSGAAGLDRRERAATRHAVASPGRAAGRDEGAVLTSNGIGDGSAAARTDRSRHRRRRAGSARTSSARSRHEPRRERIRCLVRNARRRGAARSRRRPDRGGGRRRARPGRDRRAVRGRRRRVGVPRRGRDPPRSVRSASCSTSTWAERSSCSTGPAASARRGSCTCRRTRRSAPTRPSDERFDEDSPFNPYMAYGRSKLEAEQLVQRSFDRGDLATVVIRPPWFYGPFQPERQTQFFSSLRRGTLPARRAGNAAAVDGVHGQPRAGCAARRGVRRRARATRTGSPTPSRTRSRRSSRRCATRCAPRGSPVASRRLPRVPHAVAAVADAPRRRAAGGRALRAGDPRARRAEGHDRVRHRAGAQGARLRTDGRAVRGHADERALVPRPRLEALMARDRSSSPAGAGTSAACSRRAHWRAATRCGSSISNRRGPTSRRPSSSRATCATAPRSAARATASTSCSTTSPRCRWPRTATLFDSVNVGGTAQMLVAARAAGVAKVVHTSSSAVFGIPEHNPVTEDAPCRPLEAYGRAKLQAELLCHEAAASGLDVTIVRPRTILGHGRLGIIALLFDFVADGAPVFVLGDGSNRYQLVHAADLADACLRAGDRAGPSVYNIGAAEFGTMRETLQALVDHAATGSRVRSLPVAPARLAMRRARGSSVSRRSRRITGCSTPSRCTSTSAEARSELGLGAAALERVDDDRVVRVVPRAPRRPRHRERLAPPVARPPRPPAAAETPSLRVRRHGARIVSRNDAADRADPDARAGGSSRDADLRRSIRRATCSSTTNPPSCCSAPASTRPA